MMASRAHVLWLIWCCHSVPRASTHEPAQEEAPAISHVHHWAIVRALDQTVTLSADPASIEGDTAESISVTFAGVWPHENATHIWIGMYLAGEDETMVVPLKYKNVTWGATATFFQMLNYRSDIVFRLFSGWSKPVLMAESNAVVIRQPSYPTGVRLSLTTHPDEVAVTWTSTAFLSAIPRVQYSQVGSSQAPEIAYASNTTYLRSELCGAPANAEGYRCPGTFYTAKMRVQPGSMVQYRVGTEGAWSREFTFRTPSVGQSAVKVLAFGDLGEMPEDMGLFPDNVPWYTPQFAAGDPGAPNTTHALLAEHVREPADFVFHNGDISYAMGYSGEWEVFHRNIEPLTSQLPWMITIGNHERDWPATGNHGSLYNATDSLGECGVPTMRRFPSDLYASSKPPPHDQPWYELRVGPLLIIAMSTEHDFSEGSEQYKFLEKAFSKITRITEATDVAGSGISRPWVVLAGHRPFRISSAWEGDQEFAAALRTSLKSLIDGRVDLIWGAHHHSYQRTCSILDDRCTAGVGGTVVVNLGNGGATNNKANATMPPLFEYQDDTHYGYCRIYASEDNLTLEYIRSDDRQVHDRVVLTKSPVGFRPRSDWPFQHEMTV